MNEEKHKRRVLVEEEEEIEKERWWKGFGTEKERDGE